MLTIQGALKLLTLLKSGINKGGMSYFRDARGDVRIYVSNDADRTLLANKA